MIRRALILRVISVSMVIALAVVIIVSLSGSNGSTKTVEEVAGQVTGLFENDRSEKSPERMFRKHYGLNAQDYDGVELYSPISNMDAEELLIVKLRDPEQMQELRDAAEVRLQSQTNIYEGYAPAQYELCCNAVFCEEGNFFLFVIHENADQIEAAFKGAL